MPRSAKGLTDRYSLKRILGKRQRDGLNSTDPSLPIVGTRTRYYILVTARNDLETYADLNSCAEVDLVSFEFIKRYKLN
jgi:hypothetical protein